jgi:hypothetical protein
MIRLVVCLTRLYGWMDGWMDGWVVWSTHFWESGSTRTVTLHGWLGVGSLPFNFYILNEDGVMLLMRWTGWARTYISHGNGWNDIAWFLRLACQVHIHYFHVKRFFVYQFLKSQCWKPTFALCNSTGQVTWKTCTWKAVPRPP